MTGGSSIQESLVRFMGASKSEAAFLETALRSNVREMRALSRSAVKDSDWAELERYASALLAVGENLEILQLQQAGQALEKCIKGKDQDRVAQVVEKSNRILKSIAEDREKDEKSDG